MGIHCMGTYFLLRITYVSFRRESWVFSGLSRAVEINIGGMVKLQFVTTNKTKNLIILFPSKSKFTINFLHSRFIIILLFRDESSGAYIMAMSGVLVLHNTHKTSQG